jgi:hypothetical protein
MWRIPNDCESRWRLPVLRTPYGSAAVCTSPSHSQIQPGSAVLSRNTAPAFGERLHINELHGIRIFLPNLAVIENGERLQGEPRQDRIARPVIGDSGNRITHF